MNNLGIDVKKIGKPDTRQRLIEINKIIATVPDIGKRDAEDAQRELDERWARQEKDAEILIGSVMDSLTGALIKAENGETI